MKTTPKATKSRHAREAAVHLTKLIECADLIRRTNALMPDSLYATDQLHQCFMDVAYDFAWATMRDVKQKRRERRQAK